MERAFSLSLRPESPLLAAAIVGVGVAEVVVVLSLRAIAETVLAALIIIRVGRIVVRLKIGVGLAVGFSHSRKD